MLPSIYTNHTAHNKPIYSKTAYGFYWNTLDSLGTQILLMFHNIAMRSYIGIATHAIFGITFSLFYLALIVFNFGFDSSLAPFLNAYMQDRYSLKNFILYQFLPHLLLIIFIACSFYIASWWLLPQHVALVSTICMAFIFESIKKTCKYFLQLTSFCHITASCELISTLTYISIVWISYFYLVPIDIHFFWKLFMYISFTQALMLFLLLYSYCKHIATKATLSTTAVTNNLHIVSKLDYRQIFKTRFFIWCNQIVMQVFSSNFLVPLCTFYFGLEQISLLKIITSFMQLITVVTQKIIGIHSSTLFAHIKNLSPQIQQTAFASLVHRLYYIIAISYLFLPSSISKIIYSMSINPQTTLIRFCCLFALLGILCESFLALYEKWYITQEQPRFFFLLNSISLLILYSTLPFLSSIYMLFFAFIIIRFSTLIILSLRSFYCWNIRPYYTLNIIHYICIMSTFIYIYFLL